MYQVYENTFLGLNSIQLQH